MAEPRTNANTVCPCRRASDRRSSTTTAAPSENPVPSAVAANALQRLSADSPRWVLNWTKFSGVCITVAPPASAMEDSPRRSD
ncbi:hypothetical protein OHO28_39090 [Streptomyces europaeiscabiei]